MSAQEVEQMIRSLPDAELRRFAEWWEEHRAALLSSPAAPESEAVPAELRRRRQEYRDHPERFERLEDAALDQMFRDIEKSSSSSDAKPMAEIFYNRACPKSRLPEKTWSETLSKWPFSERKSTKDCDKVYDKGQKTGFSSTN